MTDEKYGWVCVACQFFVNFMTWGINSSYGVYLSYYLENEYFPDGDHLRYAFIGGLSISIALLFTPIHTYLMLKYHFRMVGIGSAIFMSVGLLGASFASKVWHLFLSQGILFGFGMSGLFVVSLNIPLKWFQKHRGLATAVGSAGSGAGGLFWSQVISVVIQKVSLPWALRISAIVSCAVNTLAMLLIREPPNYTKPDPRHYLNLNLLKSPAMQCLIVWAIFSIFGYVAILFSLSAYCRSIGISKERANLVTGLLNAGMVIGRPFIGLFGDFGGRLNISTVICVFVSLMCFLYWPFINDFASMVPFSLIVGATCGIIWACVGACTAEIAGIENVDAGLALIWIFCVLPATFSEPIALVIFNKSRLGINFYAGANYLIAALGLYGAKICQQRYLFGKNSMFNPLKKV